MFKIPKEAEVQFVIPKEKFITSADVMNDIEEISWIGVIKPKVLDVTAVHDGDKRYEEIQILRVSINTAKRLYDVGRVFFRAIKYPVLLVLYHGDRYVIGTCLFNTGKRNDSDNILHCIRFSHWIRDELMSAKAEGILNDISFTLRENSDLYSMYMKLNSVVSSYALGGISRAHVDRLFFDMAGNISKSKRDAVLSHCIPFEYHKNMGNKFMTQKSRDYTLVHDCEELWYCFMKDERIKKVIVGRRYRDMEDLIYSIEDKESEDD